MSAAAFACLCILPLYLALSVRYLRLAPRMDARARRACLGRMACFVAGTLLATALLFAGRGRWPLPLAWLLVLAGAAAAWLVGTLKRS